MRIGSVSCRCENGDVPFNMARIRHFMKLCRGRADVLCFGEAFLQGFDSLSWDYETDKSIAVPLSSPEIGQLRDWTVLYGMSLITGYIELDQDCLYSSCAVLSDGEVIHNYRRISKGWKEYTITDGHYREGTQTGSFRLRGKEMTLALCGDLWEYPDRFRTEHLLIWPVWVNYTPEEWAGGVIDEYAAQAARAADDVLMINPLCASPENHGGSFHFRQGRTAARLPFDREDVLITEIP